MAETIPSPTRAIIVSSVAPPTRRSMFVRTVTRARDCNWMPSFATAEMVPVLGQSITLGFTLVCTASRTCLPARSMAVACWKVRGIDALSDAISAFTTLDTLPPAM